MDATFEQVVARLFDDADFRAAMATDPEQLVGELDLSAEDRAALASIDLGGLGQSMVTLESRVTKGGGCPPGQVFF